ncbi:MAG: hypothetical protein M1840_001417 [Geoglossum simile]|nr:MAG: hypothetical protein M1840_001417 [Geoglossum simile]
MSGFEVVGVVLGSISLVISALEHYSRGILTMKNMKEYEYIFADIHTSFAASVGIYMDSCYILLNSLHLSDSQMKDLLEERNEDAWKDPQLRKDLERQLGANNEIYLSLVDKLNRRIVMFGKKLKLRDDLKPLWIAGDGALDKNARKKFFKNAWTRIKGGFDSDKYATLLEEIDRDIYKISKLTPSATRLEPIRAGKRNWLNFTYWKNVRDQAQRLFESLSLRFCPCSCQHPHQANLQLDVQRDYDAKGDTVRFAFLFTFRKDTYTPTPLPWDWRDVGIKTLQTPNAPCTLVLTLASAVLQLRDTPWLSKNWDIKDIYFLKNSQGISFVDHPYVSRTFASLTTLESASNKCCYCVKNEMVFALGVALLELSWGQPLLTYKTPDDLDDQRIEDSMTES